MRRFVLDTNICLAHIRDNSIYQRIERDLDLQNSNTITLISVVTKAELLSLGVKLGWGKPKISKLSRLLNQLIIIDINHSDNELIEAYYTIDAFSQGKLPDKPLNQSARNLGKNDLWIAATAYAANAELITTDKDFEHLNDSFLKVHTYKIT